MKNTCKAILLHAVENERTALDLLAASLADETVAAAFEKAVDLLTASSMTVTTACGSSGFAAKKFAHSLCCIEKPAKFVPPSEAVHGGMGVLQPGNVLVAVSKGGKTDELLPILGIAAAKGCPVIAVTANPQSPLAQAAEVVLPLPGCPESDPYNVMSTASFSATIAIFDALMMALMEETDYTEERFALIHPGGAVGKLLHAGDKP
jgi:D-arabinose 5-phosphate isomerase GutQ